MNGNQEITMHPLLTPLILECIFKKLDVSDLKTCRQVNRIWHKEATVAMRPTVTVKFESNFNKESEMESESDWELEELSVKRNKMKAFMELVQSQISTFETMPFVNDYELHDISMDHPEFWAVCGFSIKSLRLQNIVLESADIFRHAILKSCPNLENLFLFNLKVAWPKNEENAEGPLKWVPPQFPQNPNLKRIEFNGGIQLGDISFVELFSYFPSLEEVHVGPYSCQNGKRIFQALATCRKHDPQSWNMKRISFNLGILKEPESDLRFLLSGHPSLETLAVYLVKSSEQVSTFRNILRANVTTLKSLKIVGISPVDIFETPFQTMLEKVVDFSLEEAHITSLNFLRRFPNLKKLELPNCFYSLETELVEEPLNECIVSSCTELTVDFEQSSGKQLFPLFRRIPNVEKLRVRRCSNELFAGICKIFQNLVCLELEESMVNDCGISGLDEEDVERINEDGNLVRRSVTVPRPNLSSLKNLKWFRYETYRPRENDVICFCSALCGVQHLPQLQHLKVEGSTRPIWDRLCYQFPWRDP